MKNQYFNALSPKAVKRINFSVFDIEARNWTEFLLLGYYDGWSYIEFTKLEYFINYLAEKQRTKILYAHFGSGYDFRFVLPVLKAKGFEINFLQVDSRIIAINAKMGKVEYQFRDSYNLIPMSLEKATKAFAPNFQKMEAPDFDKITQQLRDYLERDCKGLWKVIQNVQSLLNNLGCNMKLTAPSTALDLYRRKHFPDFSLYRSDEMDQEFRNAYFGGRTEVFKRHGRNLYYYDFNSLYPYAMLQTMPVGKPIRISGRMRESDIGFSYITAQIPDNMKIPPLPYRTKNRGIVYPTGSISGFYAKPFLDLLEENDIHYSVDYSWVFSGEKIFHSYVSELYELKANSESKSAMYVLTKLMMNSLYGKFAERPDRVKCIINPTMEQILDKTLNLKCVNTDLDLWQQEYQRFSPNSIIWIGAYITAIAQRTLYRAFNQCSEVYYCDTDSIITDTLLPTGSELGILKLEAEINEFFAVGQKVYAYIDKSGEVEIRIKGFPKREIEKDIPGWYKRIRKAVLENDLKPFGLEYEALYGFRESLARKNKSMYYGDKVKSLINPETKRKFDGIFTRALHITEL